MKGKPLYILIALIYCCFSCKDGQSDAEDVKIIKSDLEILSTLDGKPAFETNLKGEYIGNGDFVTEDFALSGKQSVKLDSTHIYGMNYRMTDMTEGQFIQASVWQKKGGTDGTLIASIKGTDYTHKFRTFYDKNAEETDGWVQHNLTFIVTKDVERIDFFVFSGKSTAYFDDIEIKRYPVSPKNNLPKKLSLFIPEDSKTKIDGFIGNALKSEIIPSSDKKYVKGFILNGKDSVKVKLKLKGDWTDHIKSGKTSYRIKIGGNNSYEGLKTFSIQHPKTRNYIHEWIIHKMADMEGVLTTGYDFVSVKINDLNYGVYAIEEHFDKQLLESRNRREGPILKFDESGVWALYYMSRKQKVNKGKFPYFDASLISMFKENRTLKSPNLRKQFDEGQVLLNLFKNGHLKIEDIFDIDLLARFYVLMELSSNTHGLAWHNRRFYFNPVNQKLEHIVYDVIPYSKTENYRSIVKANLKLEKKEAKELNFDNAVLLSEKFKAKFLYHLERQTRPEYLDSIFDLINDELEVNLDAIHGEEPFYKFKKEEYYNNAKFLRSQIDELDSIWKIKMNEIKTVDVWFQEEKYFVRKDSFFVPEISLNAYLTEVDSQNYKLNIENYHPNIISIVGFTSNEIPSGVKYFEQPVVLKSFLGQADAVEILTSHNPKKLIFRVKNDSGKLYEKKVVPWEKPASETSRMILNKSFNINTYLFDFKLSANKVTFSKKIVIDQILYIPDHLEVHILPGTIIEFKNGGGLIVSNSFYAEGTASAPIQVICQDSSSMGITILNGGEAIIKHTNFLGLSNLNYKKWLLTGAVTIYETPTTISHVNISGNHSEDALNIIRSHFEIDHLYISDTYSDGFDADFCTGKLSNSEFLNTGNDCIDFSGSIIDINDVKIKNSGDKGVSGGERSTLNLTNIEIDGAITGIASKDDSYVKGSGILIINAEVGYAAFQKKGEYAPAKIELSDTKTSQVGQKTLVELNSIIQLNSEIFEGTEKLDIDKLYERFEKK